MMNSLNNHRLSSKHIKKAVVIFTIAITVTSFPYFALGQGTYKPSCWIISELEGVNFIMDENYKPTAANMDDPIELRLNGKDSSISTPDMAIRHVDDFMALVFSASHAVTNFEVFQIDPAAGLAIMTKNIIAHGVFSPVSGATAMVGKASPC